MDFGWIAPICTVPYEQKYLLNTLLMPLGLQALVYATWLVNKRAEKDAKKGDAKQQPEDAVTRSEYHEELEQEARASRLGDHYFAFFLTCTSYTACSDSSNL